MAEFLVIRYETRLEDILPPHQLETIHEVWDDGETACQRAWDLSRQVRGQDRAPEFYVREATSMTNLNLDRSKQYDTDLSDDGGRTWQAATSGECSAMIVAEVAHANETGAIVQVNGQIVTIDNGHDMVRWTPRR